MNIAIISGELSGDLIGGALAEELKRLVPDVELWGIGSSAMQGAGVELLADSAAWGTISFTETIHIVPKMLCQIGPMLKAEIVKRKPDVLVLIDFGAFNVRAARYAKRIGLKVCYYFPPGSWRRTGRRGAGLASITDVLAAPFPWAAERYKSLGANAIYVGHPLLERVKSRMTRDEFAAQFGMDPTKPIIGMLPGSRRQEVSHLMPTLLEAAKLLYRSVPEAQFVVGVAPSISSEEMARYLTDQPDLRDRLSDIWHEVALETGTRLVEPLARTAGKLTAQRSRILVTNNGVMLPEAALREEMEARRHSEHLRARAEHTMPPTVLAKGLTYEVMAHSDVLLTCSGTATLEASVFGTPMVILYRGSKLMELEYNLRGLKKKIKWIGLPNILADRTVAPELIQNDATPEAIAAHALKLLNDIETRQAAKVGLAEVRAAMGTPGASARTAQIVVDLARENSHT